MSLRLGLFASHGGTNLQAILDACAADQIDATPAVVISNNSKAVALERARNAGVPALHMSSVTHGDELDAATRTVLIDHGVQLVVLAGYMKRLGPKTLAEYEGRIVNVHPALLPKHGGPGMYGARVHEAVLAAQDAVTGVTVHLVDEEYDNGRVLAQQEVPVMPGDDVESLAARVLTVEHRLYVATIARIASGDIAL